MVLNRGRSENIGILRLQQEIHRTGNKLIPVALQPKPTVTDSEAAVESHADDGAVAGPSGTCVWPKDDDLSSGNKTAMDQDDDDMPGIFDLPVDRAVDKAVEKVKDIQRQQRAAVMHNVMEQAMPSALVTANEARKNPSLPPPHGPVPSSPCTVRIDRGNAKPREGDQESLHFRD